jgi:protein O-mannosyl-transferase
MAVSLDTPEKNRGQRGKFRPLAPALLVAGIWIAYWPATRFDFVNIDDPYYVRENPHVYAGLTWPGLKWVPGAIVNANWHPVTMLSHMLDCQFYGLHAGGHHVTNLLLHTANSLLVFFLLQTLTGRRWASFFVAALFAWHPLRVESVAWIAERKDVLSAFFGLLSMQAYVRYAQVNPAMACSRRKNYYLLSLLLFALALMSKPMLVTLPLVLLLLDFWPLRRFAGGSWKRLALEKAPFLCLAALSCGITLWAQNAGSALVSVKVLPLEVRVANAVSAYYCYLWKTLWPTNLAVFYPHGNPKLTWMAGLAAAGLAILTVAALRQKRFLYLTVGWLWFLVMLVPVIGLVQVGSQALADRYTYLPSIGLFLIGVFGLADLAARFRGAKTVIVGAGILALAGYLTVTARQVGYWRNSETLFRRATDVTQNNFAAYNYLGITLERDGRLNEAVEYYEKAVQIFPGYAESHANLGRSYRQLKQLARAKSEFETALQLDPASEPTRYLLGNLLLAQGDTAGAIRLYRAALATSPNRAETHYQLATALMARNEIQEGVQEYREALRLRPDWTEALNNLSWSLATQPDARFRNGKEAVRLATRAVALILTNNANSLDTLAAAYAENSQFTEATRTARQAASLARSAGHTNAAGQIESRLRLYEKSQPYREHLAPPVAPP